MASALSVCQVRNVRDVKRLAFGEGAISILKGRLTFLHDFTFHDFMSWLT